MENIIPRIEEPTFEEKAKREYEKRLRELKISRAKAKVLLKKTVDAYEILDNIRFDYLSDTMFRDYYTQAKIELESAIGDFHLSDNYWKESIDRHCNMTPEEYYEKIVKLSNGESSSVSLNK